jgi:hypothetical protein
MRIGLDLFAILFRAIPLNLASDSRVAVTLAHLWHPRFSTEAPRRHSSSPSMQTR